MIVIFNWPCTYEKILLVRFWGYHLKTTEVLSTCLVLLLYNPWLNSPPGLPCFLEPSDSTPLPFKQFLCPPPPGLAVWRWEPSTQRSGGQLVQPAQDQLSGGAGLLRGCSLRGRAGQVSWLVDWLIDWCTDWGRNSSVVCWARCTAIYSITGSTLLWASGREDFSLRVMGSDSIPLISFG